MTDATITALILDRLSKFLDRPVHEEELDKGYDALGADSMDMVVLAYELEKLMGKKVVPEVFMQHDTIRGALDALMSQDEPADAS